MAPNTRAVPRWLAPSDGTNHHLSERVIRVVLYLRISPKPDEDREVAAIERQYAECMEYCKRRGWEVVKVFTDESVSATSRKVRKGYQEMLEFLRAGHAEGVVCWAIDRLYRKPVDLEWFLDLAERGTLVMGSPQGSYDPYSPEGRWMLRGLVANAKMQMEHKSSQQKASHRQRAGKLQPWSARRPFGYTIKRSKADGCIYEEHPDEAPVVRRMYADLLAGVSQHAIAGWLNKEGWRTSTRNEQWPDGAPWSQSAVRNFMLAPRNAGLLTYRSTEDERKVPQHQADNAPGNWTGLVSEEVWYAAVAKMTTRPMEQEAVGRKHLLSGLITCEACGNNKVGVTYIYRKHAGRSQRGYGCRNMDCPHPPRRKAEPIEVTVVEAFMLWLEQHAEGAIFAPQEQPSGESLATRAAALQKQLDDFTVNGARSGLSPRAVRLSTQAIEADLQEVKEAMRANVKGTALDPLLDGKARQTWEAWTEEGPDSLDRRRAALVAAGAKITMLPARKGERPDPSKQLTITFGGTR